MEYTSSYLTNWDEKGLEKIVGRKVTRIHMSEELLTIETTDSLFQFAVEGDCCSYSYFYDFHGVKKLLENGPVLSVRRLSLAPPDDEDSRKGDDVQAYGFELVTEHEKWGEQTSVFSFRNDSNGYYGGNMYLVHEGKVGEPVVHQVPPETELLDDCLQVVSR